ncbi:MAG: hypothetical protein HWD61_09725 [Parachlamydiaceae bacterium]|nr:MAG: hypothetical protein HWD61_09725 [Parachlamydiaceae bacterium]
MDFYQPDPTEYEDYEWCNDYKNRFMEKHQNDEDYLLMEELKDEHGAQAAKALFEQELMRRKQKIPQKLELKKRQRRKHRSLKIREIKIKLKSNLKLLFNQFKVKLKNQMPNFQS